MSGVIGKGNRSYIKAQVGESLLGDFNVTSLQWVHEITAAEVAGRAAGTTFRIDFTSLNFPTTNDIRVAGFTNPATNRITALGIGNHRTNLTVKTSLKRELIDFLSYSADDTGITLTSDVSITAGESFIFTFDQNVQNGNRVVNARPLRKTAIIPAQRRRIAIGSTIEVAPSIVNADGIDSQQIGNIQVFAEGKILFRNAGNVAGDILTSGNYREVFLDNVTDAGIEAANVVNNGTANAIELNVALTQEADIMIISTNLIVDSTTNTISLLTNEAATKLNELPTLDAANASQFLQVNAAGNAYQLAGGIGGVLGSTLITTTGTTHNVPIPSGTVALRVTAAGGGGGGGGGGNGNNRPNAVGGPGAQAGQSLIELIAIGSGANDISTTATQVQVSIGTGGAGVAGLARGGANTQGDPTQPSSGNPTTLTALRGSDNTSFTFVNAIGGAGIYSSGSDYPSFFANGSAGVGVVAQYAGDDPTYKLGGPGASNGIARGGVPGFGNAISNDSTGGGGGGGAGWFNGSGGSSTGDQGERGQTGGTGGNGGMYIEFLAIAPSIF